jgi:16S rRNA (cytosine1402-N4)-methyltransferase
MTHDPSGHDPVLLAELLDLLPVKPGDVFVDCTLGRGGHALRFGQRLGPEGLLVGMDADERNLAFAAERLKDLPCRKRFFHANFAELTEVLKQAVVGAGHIGAGQVGAGQGGHQGGGVTALLADLGVSTNQLFDSTYGMSMSVDGALDMRLDRSRGVSAAEIVNRWPEEKVADVIYQHGDERYSRRIARKIVAERRVSPILTTERLAEIVRSAIPPAPKSERGGIDPATRTFQALRMEANGEVKNLVRLLQEAPGCLNRGGGRMGVISFHSGEDRHVKQQFRQLESGMPGSEFRVIGKKPVAPGEAEVTSNPRSRSAKLRILERC